MFHPDSTCLCGHPGRVHRPSAVSPYGRGMCRPKMCGCRQMVLPDIPAPRPLFEPGPGCRYGLVVHRLRPRRQHSSGEFVAPELIEAVPTVHADVAHTIGHPEEPEVVYVDWLGGDMHGVHPDTIRIAGCGCGRPIHVFGDRNPLLITEMTPVLRWVNSNTSAADWCELVPILAAAA